ncbi:ribosome assembly cofactor RimP [Sphingobacterium gobiense]|uniref:Ribosome maturation factor RimP n=1 Tax=Sphingobacterium gobiense TaxID=1382456 RepID=A0A2S9JT88_9SPHI|nr:ribosome assembly cofactor RimP [Sphingobacterium gobiense]PRD56453.1 ribosome assembly cofactor RimP [Sphingobacterium gobiense]
MQIEERVRELVAEKISDRGDLFIVRIKMHNSGLLEILMDGDNGIAIEDCVQISRHVGFHLEEEDVIDRAYRLEVSSPGIDTPLLLHRQYQKNIGRSVRINSSEGEKREGKLIVVNDKSVVIEEVKKEKGKKAVTQEAEIPLDNITEIKVLISFK